MVIYDQGREGPHGAAFLERSWRLDRGIRRILLTAHADAESAISSINRPFIDHYLVRPWEPAEDRLFPVVDDQLAEWRASVQHPYMRVRGVMAVRPVRIREDESVLRAAEIVALSGVSDLMVVREDGSFAGVLSVGDILRAAMPGRGRGDGARAARSTSRFICSCGTGSDLATAADRAARHSRADHRSIRTITSRRSAAVLLEQADRPAAGAAGRTARRHGVARGHLPGDRRGRCDGRARRQVARAPRRARGVAAERRRLGHDNLGSLSFATASCRASSRVARCPLATRRGTSSRRRSPRCSARYTTRASGSIGCPCSSAGERDLPDERRAARLVDLQHPRARLLVRGPDAAEPASPTRSSVPWEELTRRLARPAPHLSFIDLNTHNWHFIDPHAADPIRVGEPAARRADGRQRGRAPVPDDAGRDGLSLLADARAPSARAGGRARATTRARSSASSSFIGEALKRSDVHARFMKVNPNPYAARHYVNPVVWGKTAALFASPFQKDYVPGPSGTAIPSFTTLDMFFGRKRFKTTVGRETRRDPRTGSRASGASGSTRWKGSRFRSTSRGAATRELAGVYEETKDAYAGEAGLIARHRLKAYGYLDLSFKAGRVKTLGGFAGRFAERVWDRMATVLEDTRRERYDAAAEVVPRRAGEARGGAARTATAPAVRRVVLDMSGTGIRYAAGDRCGDPAGERRRAVVERTLARAARHRRRAHRARLRRGARTWRSATATRRAVLPLRTLLALRPHRAGRPRRRRWSLYALSSNERLASHHRRARRGPVGARGCAVAARGGRLRPAATLEGGAGRPRAHLPHRAAGALAPVLHLVGDGRPARARRERDPSHRRRAAHTTIEGTEVSRARHRARHCVRLSRACSRAPARRVRGACRSSVVRPPRFSLPADPARPVVMIAGGTGVAPMLGLARERARTPGAGPTWLFLGVRTAEELEYATSSSRRSSRLGSCA